MHGVMVAVLHVPPVLVEGARNRYRGTVAIEETGYGTLQYLTV